MQHLTKVFKSTPQTTSFELFPPKTDRGYENLLTVIDQLAGLKPDFISCTYGAGGGSRDKTLDVVEHIQKKHGIIGVAHLTCVMHTKEDIRSILQDIKSRGIQNVLALRGDPPRDNPGWKPGPDNFQYSCDLCAFIREHFGGYFGIGVAGFPEGHPLAANKDEDAKHLKSKIDNGGDFVITQLFFDNQDYFEYVKRLKGLDVNVRVLPGILPITDYNNLLRFCDMCGATVTDEVKRIFEPLKEDKEKTCEEGIRFAVRQCKELLAGGAPGLHFYALNKFEPVNTILQTLKD